MSKPKYIETPEKLWELFEEFAKYKSENPRKIEKAMQSGKVLTEAMRVPLTMSGFRVYGHNKGVSIEHYFANTDGSYAEYRTVCNRVRDCIREDQIEGGMVGQYNSSITQRLNNLTERTDVTTGGSKISKIEIEYIKPKDVNSEDSSN